MFNCRLFVVAFATALAFGQKPELYYYVQEEMWQHLFNCIMENEISMFPFKRKHKSVKLKTMEVVTVHSHKFGKMIECSKCKECFL